MRVRLVIVPDEESEDISVRSSDDLVRRGYVGDFAIDMNDSFFTRDLAAQGLKYPPLVEGRGELSFSLPKRITIGAGYDVKAWLQHVRHGARVPRDGFSDLVDYGDRGTCALPNCLATCFGHGVYTSYDAMLFNARLFADHFYR